MPKKKEKSDTPEIDIQVKVGTAVLKPHNGKYFQISTPPRDPDDGRTICAHGSADPMFCRKCMEGE